MLVHPLRKHAYLCLVNGDTLSPRPSENLCGKKILVNMIYMRRVCEHAGKCVLSLGNIKNLCSDGQSSLQCHAIYVVLG